MSGETEKFVSGWTTDTLKELVDAKLEGIEESITTIAQVASERDIRYSQRFNAQQEALTAALSAAKEAVAAALLAADRAVTKAELASEKRFESVNEFRGALSDQTSKLVTRNEAETKYQGYDEKIDLLRSEIAGLREARSVGVGEGHGLNVAWQLMLGISAVAVAVGTILYTVHALTGK